MAAAPPAALTPALLAYYRPSAAVAVALGAPLGIQRRRPRGYQLAARAQAGSGGSSRGVSVGEVAVVQVRGVMEQRESAWSCGETCGYDGIERDVCAALTDPGVAALVIDADTPGGDEPGLEETADRIAEVVAALGKPVIGYTPAMLASAGVRLLFGICTEVDMGDGPGPALYCHRTARVGSVSSVVVFHSDARRLAEEGTDVYVARGLPGKMNPNPLEPLDELGKARLDRHALACSEDFIAFVAAKCGIDPEAVRAWNADLFRGQDAVDVGLVRGLGTLDQVISLAGQLAGLQEAA